jgi:LysM domain
MGRLGLVATTGRGWRAYAGPAAFLLAVTIAVVLLRTQLLHHSGGGGPGSTHAVRKSTPPHRKRSVYVVRAGDTIVGIAAKTGVPATRLLQLNPKVSPTALFIGQKLRLR